MERRSNETLTLSAGHISGLKVRAARSGEEAAGFEGSCADDGGRCGWLRPLQTLASHTHVIALPMETLRKDYLSFMIFLS